MAEDHEDVLPGNPAERLVRLLKGARELTPPVDKLRIGWGELLGVDPDDRALLLARLGDVVRLPAEVREAVAAVADDHSDLTKYLPEVERALSMLNLEGQKWEAFTKAFSDTAIRELEFISRELENSGHWRSARLDVIDDLRDRTAQLIDDLLESEIDEGVRLFIHSHLSDVRDALERYRVVGPGPLKRAFNGAVGDLVMTVEAQDSRNHPMMKKFGALMAAVGLLLTGANQTLELAERVQTVFGLDADAANADTPELEESSTDAPAKTGESEDSARPADDEPGTDEDEPPS